MFPRLLTACPGQRVNQFNSISIVRAIIAVLLQNTDPNQPSSILAKPFQIQYPISNLRSLALEAKSLCVFWGPT